MRITIVLLLLSFNLSAQVPEAFTNDDNLHYLAGLNISNFVGSSVYYITERPFISCAAGFVEGALAGWAKDEIHDRRMGRGVYQVGDITTTIWGSLAGAITLRIGIHEFHEKRRSADLQKYEFDFPVKDNTEYGKDTKQNNQKDVEAAR